MPGINLKDHVQWRTTQGDPHEVNGALITPVTQALVIRTPVWGFVWNRPVAVLVEQDGETRRLPIVDPTRVALIAIGAGVAAGLIAASIARSGRARRAA